MSGGSCATAAVCRNLPWLGCSRRLLVLVALVLPPAVPAQSQPPRHGAHGAGYWQVTGARLAPADVDLWAKLSGDQRRQLEQADARLVEARKRSDEGKYREAITLAQQVLDTRRAILGETHLGTGDACSWLGVLCYRAGDYARAEPLYRQAMEITKKVLGEEHPNYATNLNNLGLLYHEQGDDARAEPLYRQALEIRKKVSGEEHPDYAISLSNLGWLYQKQGDYARAEPLLRQALEIRKKILGEEHPDYAASANNLALLYRDQGDNARAEPLFRQALEIKTKQRGASHWEVTEARLALADVDLWAKLSGDQRQQLDQADARLAEARKRFGEGKYREAIVLAQQVLDTRRPILGETHRGTGDACSLLGFSCYSAGDYARAEPLYRQALGIYKKTFGEENPHYAGNLNNLAVLYCTLGDYARAEPLQRQALEITKKMLGEEHHDYATNLYNLGALYYKQRDYARAEPLVRQALEIRKKVLGEEHPHYAVSIDSLATLYHDLGDYARAEPLYRQALEIKKKVLGEEHPKYTAALDKLAAFCNTHGDYARAEPLFRQALEIKKNVLGEQHPDYAAGLNKLAAFYEAHWDYARAESLHRQMLEIKKKVAGEEHPDYANGLDKLAEIHEAQGDYALAEPLYRQALEIKKKVLGEEHPDYANSLDKLAEIHEVQGDDARAEPLYRQALQIRKKVLGEEDPDYANSLSHLALLYYKQGDYGRAEPLFRQALEIEKEASGEEYPDYADNLSHLALLYQTQGYYARAEPLYRQAMKIVEEALDDEHPDYANRLDNLAALYHAQGDYARAEPLYRQAMEIRKKILGEEHVDYAASLNHLAALYDDRGDHARAGPLFRQALEIVRRHVELTAAALSERQQLAMARTMRFCLDGYLSPPPQGQDAAAATYAEVLAWKGTLAARHRLLRPRRAALSADDQPELAALFQRLAGATRGLASLSRAAANPEQAKDRRRRLAELTNEIEDLRRDLAGANAEFRRALNEQRIGPADVRRCLPADVALVDLLEYNHSKPSSTRPGELDRQRRLTAFVVRRDAPVTRVELGPVEAIGELVTQWLEGLAAPGREGLVPGRQLRDLVWGPLEPHLTGVKTVLISPDGPLSSLPWAALPGGMEGSYLLEELAVVVVPAPRLLPELLRADVGEGAVPASILLVGDVDLGASPGDTSLAANSPTSNSTGAASPQSDVRGEDGSVSFPELKGTRVEILAVSDSFEWAFPKAAVEPPQSQERETKQAARQQTPRHRGLHFATHGVFASEKAVSAPAASRADDAHRIGLFSQRDIPGFHPGLLWGLALAGANRPTEPKRDDGVLTALEVEELDLGGVELVTLSACRAGLAKAADGEGVLGLQRAFQVAGARSVLASLWGVDDDAKRAMLIDFYDNLWSKRMPKIEALRQAQLKMLKEGFSRGLKLADDRPADRGNRPPPRYWAGFVLSGDWR